MQEQQLDFWHILEVNQSVFQGPLALLLDLIRKKRMDIFSISLTEICMPYLNVLKEMQNWSWELATEFFDIASLLILIKSKSLLPQLEETLNEEETNPEEELRRKLIVYQAWQNIAQQLSEKEYVGRDIFLHTTKEVFGIKNVIYEEEIDIHQLLKIYHRCLQKKSYYKEHTIDKEEISFQDYVVKIWQRIWQTKQISFYDLLPTKKGTVDFILGFICVLELAKRKYVYLLQEGTNDALYILLDKDAPKSLIGSELIKENKI